MHAPRVRLLGVGAPGWRRGRRCPPGSPAPMACGGRRRTQRCRSARGAIGSDAEVKGAAWVCGHGGDCGGALVSRQAGSRMVVAPHLVLGDAGGVVLLLHVHHRLQLLAGEAVGLRGGQGWWWGRGRGEVHSAGCGAGGTQRCPAATTLRLGPDLTAHKPQLPRAPRTRSPGSRTRTARWRPSPAAAPRRTGPRCRRQTPGSACPAGWQRGARRAGAGVGQRMSSGLRGCRTALGDAGRDHVAHACRGGAHLQALALVLQHVLNKQHGAVAGGLRADLRAAVLLAARG